MSEKIYPHPAKDLEQEEAFRQNDKREAPINVGLFYGYSCDPHTLKSPKENLNVLRTRVTGKGASGGTKAPFTATYVKGEATRARKIICLHFTAGGFRGSLGALTTDVSHAQPNKQYVSVPFMIGRSGNIYELHDDGDWAQSSSRGAKNEETIAIELINVGPLIRGDDGYHVVGEKGALGALYCGLDEHSELVDTLAEPFRGYVHYATYTKKQYDSLKKLLKYLTDKYAIPPRFLEAKDPRDPKAERYAFKAVPENWMGIASHVNFQDKTKWDIGPAFDWPYLTQQDLSLPVRVQDVGGAAKPGAKKDDAPMDKAVGDDLQISDASLKQFFKHTETDTADHGGSYPVGINTLWHGGVHLFVDQVPVHNCFEGQVVAARLRTPDLEGSAPPKDYGSGAFVLVRHELTTSLIAQLDPLLMPSSYTLTKVDASTPGAKFSGSSPLPAAFTFEPGDTFARVDPADTRAAESKNGIAYDVEMTLTNVVVQVNGFEVVGVIDKDKSHAPLLEVKKPSGTPAFALERGDAVVFVGENGEGVLRRDLKKNKDYEVELARLGDGVSTVNNYTVKGEWHLGFRKAANTPPPSDEDASKDTNRLPDLKKGDVLEVLDVDPDIEGEIDGDVEVKITSLAKDNQDFESLVLTKGTQRILLESLADAAEPLCALLPGDEITLIQREARIIHAENKNPKKAKPSIRYDLVALSKIAAKPEVPNLNVIGTTKKGCALYEDANKKQKPIKYLPRGSELKVVSANRFPWIEVSTETGDGFVFYSESSLSLPLVARDKADWMTELLARPGFVTSLSNGDLKTAIKKDRALKVGDKGFVKVPSGDLAPDGTKRAVKHGDKVSGAGRLRGTVRYNPSLLAPTGKNRLDLFPELAARRGKLTFDSASMTESRVVREELLARAGKPFYSLYMHLDDAKVTKESAKQVAWLPREVSSLRLKQAATWITKNGESIPLIAGDKLTPSRPWSTDEPPTPDQELTWDEIAAAELVEAIVVKAHKGTVWLCGASQREKLSLLSAGQRLLPKHLAASFRKGHPVEVRLDSPPPWKVRTAPEKRTTLRSDSGLASGWLVKQERVLELGTDGDRSFVRSEGRPRVEGWIKSKDLGPVVGQRVEAPKEGTVFWNDTFFEASKVSRAKYLDQYKGSNGRVDPSLSEIAKPGFSDREESVDSNVLARLNRAEIVQFPLAFAATSTCTKVKSGDLLWKSGTFAPVLPKSSPTGAQGKLIHWEIFSPECLLSARPFRPTDDKLWGEMKWPWWEVSDTDDDWTMDCKEILAMVGKGIAETAAEQDREKLVGEILNPKEVESLYKNPEVAAKLRHAACQFKLEWAVDARVGLRHMKSAELDHAWWAQLKQRFSGGQKQDWSQHIDDEWADRQGRYFAPLLWWKDTTANPPKGASGLPTTTLVWHYNPIAFLEAFSSAERKRRREASEKGH